MGLNAVAKIHRVQERLIASREYILAEGYPERASTELRRQAMTFCLEMCTISSIKQSTPIFIEGEMLRLVQHAMHTLPDDARFSSETLMFPNGLVYADQPLAILAKDSPIVVSQWGTHANWGAGRVAYLSWHDIPRHKWHRPMRAPLLWPFLTGAVVEGATLKEFQNRGDPAALDDHTTFARFMITLWIMLQQRIAVKEDEQRNVALSRTRRTDAVAPPRTVMVVRLRRPSNDDGSEHRNSPVDWSHRWMVNGFWRNQYHPSTGEHAPTWIAPYIKGPGDKPLVLKERIYTFVR
jgi:hypothetical protein